MSDLTHSTLAYHVPGADGDGLRVHRVTDHNGVQHGLVELIDSDGRPTHGIKFTAAKLKMAASAFNALAIEISD